MTDHAEPVLDLVRLSGSKFSQDLKAFDSTFTPLSDCARRESLERTLAHAAVVCPVAVFAYGSLLWNPLVNISTSFPGQVFGYHRRLCLITRVARGSPEAPGLTLGLDYGGSCFGKILVISQASVDADLTLLWRREMADDAYEPRWVECRTASGWQRAIAFVAKRSHPRFFVERSPLVAAKFVAQATGAFGSCYDYVFRTVEALRSAGVSDAYLEQVLASATRIRQTVRAGEGCAG